MSNLEANALNNDLATIGAMVTLTDYDKRSEIISHTDRIRSNLDKDVTKAEDELQLVKTHLSVLTSPSWHHSAVDCDSVSCLMRHKCTVKWPNAWKKLKCTNCNAKVHYCCTKLCFTDLDAEKESTTYVCGQCAPETISTVTRRLNSRLSEAERFLRTMTASRDEYPSNDMVASVVDGKGQCYSALSRMLRSIGVARSLYHQQYNGRQIGQCLRLGNLSKLFELAGITNISHPALWMSMVALRGILRLAKPRFLTDEELARLCLLVEAIKASYHEAITQCSRSVKYHYLVTHLVEYASLHRTIGLVTEEGLESKHVVAERSWDQFRNISDLGERLLRCTVEQEIVIQEHRES